jgi:hypothetical protein
MLNQLIATWERSRVVFLFGKDLAGFSKPGRSSFLTKTVWKKLSKLNFSRKIPSTGYIAFSLKPYLGKPGGWKKSREGGKKATRTEICSGPFRCFHNGIILIVNCFKMLFKTNKKF